MRDGRRWRVSLGTTNIDRARSRLDALLHGDPADDKPRGISLAAAVAEFLADCRARNLRESSIESYDRTLRQLTEALPGVPLSALTVATLEQFRRARKVCPATARKELQTLRSFCAYLLRRKHIAENPAAVIRAPRVEDPPTLPFSDEEVVRLISATDRIKAIKRPEETPYFRRRARALVLVMLYSGLRIGDVAALRRSALDSRGHLTLRVEKTGVPLKVLLHPDAVDALNRLESANPAYFFWNGRSRLITLIKIIGRILRDLGKLAGVHCHAHKFRDTFARKLLESGADIRTVQKLLGHTSVQTTEKHYAPWVASHQELLDVAASKVDFSPKSKPVLVRKRRG